MSGKDAKGRFQKGHKKAGGRAKGTQNKITLDVRAAIEGALEEAHPQGKKAYLIELARGTEKERQAFVALVGKIIPKEIKLEATMRETVTVRNFTGLRVDKLPKSVLRRLIED